MTRKGGFLKGIVTSAATYAVKTAVDIAVNPENMQKVSQLVSEQQVGSKLKQAAAWMPKAFAKPSPKLWLVPDWSAFPSCIKDSMV